MAKKPPVVKLAKSEFAAYENPPTAAVQKAFDISDETLLSQRIDEIAKLIWVHEDADEQIKHARVVRALELYESLKPADGAEGMLAIQMVGTHDAALECLRRAALPNQTYEGRDMALKHAQKLMTLYAKQLETLNKHRGKGQQKVTVEHVNVAPGGQAIVGNVTHQRSAADEQSREMLEKHETPVVETAPRKASVKRRKS